MCLCVFECVVVCVLVCELDNCLAECVRKLLFTLDQVCESCCLRIANSLVRVRLQPIANGNQLL